MEHQPRPALAALNALELCSVLRRTHVRCWLQDGVHVPSVTATEIAVIHR